MSTYPPHALVLDLEFMRLNDPDSVPDLPRFDRLLSGVLVSALVIGDADEIEDYIDQGEFGEAWEDVFDRLDPCYCASAKSIANHYESRWSKSNVVCVANEGGKRHIHSLGLKVYDSLEDLVSWVSIPNHVVQWAQQSLPLEPAGMDSSYGSWSEFLSVTTRYCDDYWASTNSMCLFDNHLFTRKDWLEIFNGNGMGSYALRNLLELCKGLSQNGGLRHVLLCIGVHDNIDPKEALVRKFPSYVKEELHHYPTRSEKRLVMTKEGAEALSRILNHFFQEHELKAVVEIMGRTKKDRVLHDRHILLNHFFVSCGPGFNLFRQAGDIKQGGFAAFHIFSDAGSSVMPVQPKTAGWLALRETLSQILQREDVFCVDGNSKVCSPELLENPFVSYSANVDQQ